VRDRAGILSRQLWLKVCEDGHRTFVKFFTAETPRTYRDSEHFEVVMKIVGARCHCSCKPRLARKKRARTWGTGLSYWLVPGVLSSLAPALRSRVDLEISLGG